MYILYIYPYLDMQLSYAVLLLSHANNNYMYYLQQKHFDVGET